MPKSTYKICNLSKIKCNILRHKSCPLVPHVQLAFSCMSMGMQNLTFCVVHLLRNIRVGMNNKMKCKEYFFPFWLQIFLCLNYGSFKWFVCDVTVICVWKATKNKAKMLKMWLIEGHLACECPTWDTCLIPRGTKFSLKSNEVAAREVIYGNSHLSTESPNVSGCLWTSVT